MSKRDYYDVLGVQKGTSSVDLKKAYRKLAMKYHPDKNQGDKSAEQKFKEVNEAYDILKDDQKKAAYDQFGHAAFDQSSAGPSAGGFDFGGGFGDIFDDMFGDIMGRRRGSSSAQTRGSDLRYNMEITLENAFHGKKATIDIPTAVSCDLCSGTGTKGGALPDTCNTCNGFGKVRTQKGFFSVERGCPGCGGSGKVIRNPCSACRGSGRVQKENRLEVSIPAGVEDGTRIRLTGKGEAGLNGAPPGDLYIFLAVKNHHLFERDGADLYLKVPVSMTVAALGGDVEVPSLEGKKVRVTIPRGCQNNHQFRLRGKGMTLLRSKSRGDMFIEAAVEVPVNLNSKQKKLLREFEAEGDKKIYSPLSQGFFDRIKSFFDESNH